MKNKIIFFVFFIFLFISCNKEKTKEKEQDMYGILNVLINKYKHSNVSPVFLPVNNPFFKKNFKKFDTKDSLFSYKYFYEKISEKKNIAINKKMTAAHLNIDKITCIDKKKYSLLIKELTSSKEEKKIAIKNVILYPKRDEFEKDSIMYFSEKFKLLKSKDFPKELNMLFNFSNIVFNEKNNKALVVMNLSFSRLDGFSVLIYLEKKDYHWEIICEQGLSIS